MLEMFPLFFDPTWILLLPALIFAMYAQAKVQSTFARYLRVPARAGYTGAQVARQILDRANLHDVRVEMTHRHLGDHYDPRQRVVRLSPEVYNGRSVASVGVAAHETGHALQHARAYVPLSIRNSLFPVAAFGSSAAFPLFFIGLLFGSMGSWDLGYSMMTIGIWFFIAALAFQIITLPVEFDASARAMRLLTTGGYLAADEAPKTKAVLTAAALTYVAATVMAVAQLLRLLVLRGMFSQRD